VTPQTLSKALSVTLDATGSGTVTIGPSSFPGPRTWHVTGVILTTSRPGVAPIPRCIVYKNRIDPNSIQGLSYDGSFAQGACDETLTPGQSFIAIWSGGQAGDVASITVTGDKT
jgi:hypothetical protein